MKPIDLAFCSSTENIGFLKAHFGSKGCRQLLLQIDALLCIAIYDWAADGLTQRRHLVLDLLLALYSCLPESAHKRLVLHPYE